jgi:hypothetical protein
MGPRNLPEDDLNMKNLDLTLAGVFAAARGGGAELLWKGRKIKFKVL